MRRAEVPPEDRGDVYRLVFFAWADGGLKWEEEKVMRRYAKEMGWQWRRFSRTLEHYKRLCAPESRYRLPVFLLRNLKQSLPEVSPEFGQSFDAVSPKFDQSLPEVSLEFDAQNGPKPFPHGASHDMSESRVRSQNQNPEREAAPPPSNGSETSEAVLDGLEDAILFTYQLTAVDSRLDGQVKRQVGLLNAAGCSPASLREFLGQRQKLPSLNFLAQDWQQWRTNSHRSPVTPGEATRPPIVTAPPDWGRRRSKGDTQ